MVYDSKFPVFQKNKQDPGVGSIMFETLVSINKRPKPFEYYTIKSLWNDEHTSEQMLKYHLNPEIDLSSRNTRFIDRSVEWIVSRFNVGQGIQIADFGCGPGLYASRLAQRHASVTGIDISKRSIRYAQNMAEKDGQEIQYVNQNYLEYETEDRFDLIIMIMCDFCALSPKQRKVLLFKFSELLRPNGAVLLDVYSLEGFSEREEQAVYEADLLDGFWSPNKYYGFLNTIKYEEEKVVLDKYTIIESARMWTVYNWLQYFSPKSLKKEFEEAGFEVQSYYANVAGAPFDETASEFAVVGIKA
jgi:2-polyprenyl-3-methyl-5-hydroxy-6-metoxy-1,4-benzoquinol methylase